MKKLVIFSFFTIFLFSFYSCEKPVTTTVTTVTTKTMLTEPGTNGFLISQEIVVKGNTVWGFSRESYGTGMQWRDIVAQNPFLQQPGRVYYNQARKMWIVKIHVGEVVKIGGSIITPSCVVEETTTTSKTTPAPEPIFYWWGWVIAVLIIALIIALMVMIKNSHNNTSIIHVDLRNGGGIDTATKVAIISAETERSYIFRENVAKQMLQHPDLASAHLTESSNPAEKFTLSTEYRESKRS